MQKVDGSSPFIRSEKPAGNGGFSMGYSESYTPEGALARCWLGSSFPHTRAVD
jgi:hypothetical protein